MSNFFRRRSIIRPCILIPLERLNVRLDEHGELVRLAIPEEIVDPKRHPVRLDRHAIPVVLLKLKLHDK